MTWRTRAACRDLPTDIFFWSQKNPGGASKADLQKRKVAFHACRSCPVQPECLDYAVSTVQPAGLWGGMTPRQRRKLRKKEAA